MVLPIFVGGASVPRHYASSREGDGAEVGASAGG